jgi:predicted DNA-binding protein
MKRRGGRPPIADRAATKVIYVRVTETTARDLVDIARLNQKTRAEFIREAIEEAVADCTERRVFAART